MSGEQEKVVNELIEEARCAAKDAREAKKTYSLLIRIFAVAIFIAVSSVSALTWQIIAQSKEINYVRERALNKDAFINIVETYAVNTESLTKLITDPNIQLIVADFNRKTDAIINRMMSSETEIQPRGVTEISKGGSK